MAGGVAFALFTCAVPFALVLLAILGRVFEQPEIAAEIYALVDRLVPYPEEAGAIKDILAARFEQMSSITDLVGLAGFLALLLASTGLFSALRTTLNTVFRISDEESVLHGKLWDTVLVIAVLVATVLLMIAIPALEAGMELARESGWLGPLNIDFFDRAVINVISLVSLLIVFSAVYWLVPYRRVELGKIVVGAIVASFLWLAAKEIFGYYINHAATLRHVYGVYTFVVVSAFWVYYSALILIVGAEIGQLYYERS
jgi:YihY family inner membrane protein